MRTFKYDLLKEIKDRWSARALSTQVIDKEEIYALIEAASYAPSSNNEQPWRFMIGFDSNTLNQLRDALIPNNLEWAQRAPVLILLLSKRTFTKNGKVNLYNQFDAGSAFSFLSLEATKRGLIAHGMGGFDKDLVRTSFNIDEDYDVLLMIAIGYPGDKSLLNEGHLEREKPGIRKDLSEIIINAQSL